MVADYDIEEGAGCRFLAGKHQMSVVPAPNQKKDGVVVLSSLCEKVQYIAQVPAASSSQS